jgi:uncharacterized membrane protein
MKSNFNENNEDKMLNDPDNYKWGIFYFNPDDGRTIVPKRNRWMGFTLNFANPFSYFIILGFILLAVFIGKLDR